MLGSFTGCGSKRFIPTALVASCFFVLLFWFQGCGIKVIGNLPLYCGVSLWEALFVVSQKWAFPTALSGSVHFYQGATIRVAKVCLFLETPLFQGALSILSH